MFLIWTYRCWLWSYHELIDVSYFSLGFLSTTSYRTFSIHSNLFERILCFSYDAIKQPKIMYGWDEHDIPILRIFYSCVFRIMWIKEPLSLFIALIVACLVFGKSYISSKKLLYLLLSMFQNIWSFRFVLKFDQVYN